MPAVGISGSKDVRVGEGCGGRDGGLGEDAVAEDKM
mgnify:CR=1 FL=1